MKCYLDEKTDIGHLA